MEEVLIQRKLLKSIDSAIESNNQDLLREKLVQYTNDYPELISQLIEPFISLVKTNPQLAEVFLETSAVSFSYRKVNLQFEDAIANLKIDDLPPRIKNEAQQLAYTEEMIRAIENKDLEKAKQLIQDGLQVNRNFVYNNKGSENFPLLAIRANAADIFKELIKNPRSPNPFDDNLLDYQALQRQPNAFQLLMEHQLYSKSYKNSIDENNGPQANVKAIYHAAVENNLFKTRLAKAYAFRELPNVFSVDDINVLVKKGLPIETSLNGQTHTLVHGMVGHKAYPNEVKSLLKTLTDNGFDLNKPDYTGRSFIETVSQVSFGAPRFSDWKEGTDNFLKENPQFNLNVEKKKDLSFKP